jgi:hypothetical protein
MVFNRQWHNEVTRGETETQTVAIVLLGLGGTLGVILVQYLARRLLYSLLPAVLSMALLMTVILRGWDFSALWARALRTSPHAASITPTFEFTRDYEELDLTLRGVPEGMVPRLSADHVWRYNGLDRKICERYTIQTWELGTASRWSTIPELKALGFPDSAVSAYAPDATRGVQNEATWLVHRRRDEGALPTLWSLASLRSTIHVDLLRPERVADLALKPRQGWREPGRQVAIISSAWKDDQYHVVILESVPRAADLPTCYALVNHAEGKALKLWPGEIKSMVIGSQKLTWTDLSRAVSRDAPTDTIDQPPRWLEGATMAVLQYREVEQFDRELTIEGPPRK